MHQVPYTCPCTIPPQQNPNPIPIDTFRTPPPMPPHADPLFYFPRHNMPPLLPFLLLLLLLLPILPILPLLYLTHRLAFPPWHHPNPRASLTTHSLPTTWTHHTSATLPLPHPPLTLLIPTPTPPLHLSAWLLPAHPSTPSPLAICCVHGAGRDRRAFLQHSAFLVQHGYDVLLFDCLNHGTSDQKPPWPCGKWPGRAITLGTHEAHDVSTAVAFLRARGARHVIVMGTSQGAVAALLASVQGAGIDAIILENPFVSPRALLHGIVDVILGPFNPPGLKWLKALVVYLALWRTGNLSAVAAEDVAAQIDVPVLFIHGDQDRMVGVWQSKTLYNAITHHRKHLWVVPGAHHTACYWKEPREFEKRVTEFAATVVQGKG